MSAAAQLYYGDDRVYAVELFDQVEVCIDGHVYDAVVRRIYTRKRELTVRYEDHLEFVRTTAEPRRKTARVPLTAAELIARDG